MGSAVTEGRSRDGSFSGAMGGRLYGLDIIRFLEQHSQLVLAEDTIYPILNRLKADGLLASEWVETEAGHPRKYYSLTRIGRERARQMAATWLEFSTGLGHLIEPVLARQEVAK